MLRAENDFEVLESMTEKLLIQTGHFIDTETTIVF